MNNSHKALDKVTVITINKNNKIGLQKTVTSVLSQDYEKLEYIIIDALSSDGSVEAISNLKGISKIISEPDRGIFDGMNKGIKYAQGDWIIFLNSGDVFSRKNIVSLSMEKKEPNTDILYGDEEIIYNFGLRRIRKARPLSNFLMEQPFSHQSQFTKTTLFKNLQYNINNKTSADYEFLLFHWKNGATFQYISEIIAVNDAHGVSNLRRIQVLKDHQQAIRKVIGKKPHLEFSYYLKLASALCNITVKRVLPKVLVEQLLKIRHSSTKIDNP